MASDGMADDNELAVTSPALAVRLRRFETADLDSVFGWQGDPEASHMAAFTVEDPSDRAAFDMRWVKILADDAIYERAVVEDDELVGYVVSFVRFGQREVGYWIDRAHWGRGIATEALRLFLEEIDERPLYARAAHDNAGSLRVLEKCGFRALARERAFARARGCQVEEIVFRLAE